MKKMKGPQLVYLLCGIFEALRFSFLYIWFSQNPGIQPAGYGNLPFLILGIPAFLILFQFFLLAWDPVGNKPMTKAQLPIKLALLVPDFLLLVQSPGLGGLWLWLVTFTDLSILWLLFSIRLSVKKSGQEDL